MATAKILNDLIDTLYAGITVRHEIGLEFSSRCHEKAGVTVRYRDAMLYVSCRKCQTPIIDIEVEKG